ncbi:MAG: disulfide bond formation protein B [Gammaproteobacteria bacterium]|nr:disulfide bond formation protein B [Gammaproteobacteria bacterium]
MRLPSPRSTYLIGFFGITVLLALAMYLQIYEGLTPCPLCMLQRFMLIGLGALFFIGAVIKFNNIFHRLLAFANCVFAVLGMVLAGRQVWLQHLPPSTGGDCGASLDYMMQVLPLTEVIKKVFIGGAECSQVNWVLFQLSLAEWSLICFILLLGLSLWQLFRKIF